MNAFYGNNLIYSDISYFAVHICTKIYKWEVLKKYLCKSNLQNFNIQSHHVKNRRSFVFVGHFHHFLIIDALIKIVAYIVDAHISLRLLTVGRYFKLEYEQWNELFFYSELFPSLMGKGLVGIVKWDMWESVSICFVAFFGINFFEMNASTATLVYQIVDWMTLIVHSKLSCLMKFYFR